jgi:hypothetical protein
MSRRPLDWAVVMTRVDIDKRHLDDALLYRRYDDAIKYVKVIQAQLTDLVVWLGSVQDGDYVANQTRPSRPDRDTAQSEAD